MTDENKPVENTEDAGNPQEGVEANQSAAPKTETDYNAILQQEIAARMKAEEERDNYRRGLLKAKGKTIEDDEMEEKTIGEVIKEEISKGLSEIKGSLAKSSLSSILGQITTNPDERKLIQYYYDNRIVKSGVDEDSIRRDLEDSRAMANKHKLEDALDEVRIAKNNRPQGSVASGSSTSGNERKTEFFTAEQKEQLSRTAAQIGIDPKKFIEQTQQNIQSLKNR